jgi:hypothetical protein
MIMYFSIYHYPGPETVRGLGPVNQRGTIGNGQTDQEMKIKGKECMKVRPFFFKKTAYADDDDSHEKEAS